MTRAYGRRPATIGFIVLCATATLSAQVRTVSTDRGPTSIVPVLDEASEITLAREAVSGSISRDADVYVYQKAHWLKAASGSNGFACMVSRSDQAASRLPMCFDSVGARTLMHRGMVRVE